MPEIHNGVIRSLIPKDVSQESGFLCYNNGMFTYKRQFDQQDGAVLDLCFQTEIRLLIGKWYRYHNFPIELEIKSDNIKYRNFLAKNKLLNSSNNLEFEADIFEIEEKLRSDIHY